MANADFVEFGGDTYDADFERCLEMAGLLSGEGGEYVE